MKTKTIGTTPVDLPKVQARGFRTPPAKPVFVRFASVPDDLKVIVAAPHRVVNGAVEIAAAAGDRARVLEFSLAPARPSGQKEARHLSHIAVEIESGGQRYVDLLFGDERQQVFRYHFFVQESLPDMILCPVHGLVRAKNGKCPASH